MIVVNDILYVAVSTECHQIDPDSVEIICGPVDVTNYVDISGIATCLILTCVCVCNDEKMVEFKVLLQIAYMQAHVRYIICRCSHAVF